MPHMTPTQRDKIEAHGRRLLAIFPTANPSDPVELCKRLRRWETKAHQAAENLCNVPNYQEAYDRTQARTLAGVDKLLNFTAVDVPVFVNGDPRGWALKIKDDWMRAHPEHQLHQDMGGYGILAPNF